MVKDFPVLNAKRNLSIDDQRERDAVQAATTATMQQDQGQLRLTLIRSVYWGKQKRNIEDVAIQLSIEKQVAERWHSDFIRQVGECWGFDTKQPPIKYRR